MKTFVVRLWVAEDAETPVLVGLRGVLEHADSARSRPFTGGEELLELLLAGLTADRAGGELASASREAPPGAGDLEVERKDTR